MRILRNRETYPGMLRGLAMIVREFSNSDAGAPHNLVIETKLTTIQFSICRNATTGTAVIATTEADSTAFPGTRNITVAVPASTSVQVFIIGTEGPYDDTSSSSAAVTDTDMEVY